MKCDSGPGVQTECIELSTENGYPKPPADYLAATTAAAGIVENGDGRVIPPPPLPAPSPTVTAAPVSPDPTAAAAAATGPVFFLFFCYF